ncbi:hypothetical protein [Gordonia spumicola]|nr:hypothetical protein [Gordonia spumicola]
MPNHDAPRSNNRGQQHHEPPRRRRRVREWDRRGHRWIWVWR